MPSIPRRGRISMPPAQKGKSKSGSVRPRARRLLHQKSPPREDQKNFLTFDLTGREAHEV
jgi:hypothetical protein